MCACDRDSLCPACAAREAAEWEPEPDAEQEHGNAGYFAGTELE